MVAPQQIIKKIKVRGYIFYIEKLSVFTICVSICRVWGFVWTV